MNVTTTTGRQNCLWEDIPSFLQLYDSLTVQYRDLLHGNYEYKSCSSLTGRYVFWLWKLSFIDVFIIVLFSMGLGFLRWKISHKIKRVLLQKLNASDKETDRAVHSLFQLIHRCVTITWIFYEIFLKPETCSVLTTPSLSWQYLDPDSIPTSTASYVMPFSTWLLYLTAISVYVFHLFAVLFLDEKRRDYIMMVIHHLLTLTAITMSYTIQFIEMGLLILFLHDIGDIFMGCGKICHYLTPRADGKKNELFGMLLDPLMCIFALSWIPTRLYLYPLRGIYALTKLTRKSCHFPSVAYGANLLSILLVLNIIWFLMIIRALVNRLVLGKLTDETIDHPEETKIKSS